MRTADVVVIGAGVVGTAAAYELAARGLEVTILERTLPNRQGSGTTAGNLHIQAIHAERPTQAVPVATDRLVPLQAAAAGLWQGLEERLGESLGVAMRGGFTVAETATQLEALRTKHVWEQSAGIATEIVDRDAIAEVVPGIGETVLAATWCALDGYANPLRVGPAYLRHAVGDGARFVPNAPVTSVTATRHGWIVGSRVGDIAAPNVVVAAGPWIQQVTTMAGHPVEMAPLAIQMHETVRAERMLPVLVQHIGRGLSVKQVDTGSVVIGGGWPAGELDLDGVSLASAASVVGNLEDATRVLPFLAPVPLSRAWAGPLAATPDEMPVVGAVPGAPGLFVAGGTYAFTFSPLWGRVLADAVLGLDPFIDTAGLEPDRLLARKEPV